MDYDDLRDAVYSIKRYLKVFKKWPNLFYPQTFNEHILHKKLFDRRPLLTQIADKYGVRAYVTERIGTEYLNELFFVTANPEEIDFDQLPEQFSIKATHGSGYNMFVSDKHAIDKHKLIKTCQEWMSKDYYKRGREWCYKNIPRRIIVEGLIKGDKGRGLTEYKFYCFGGIPTYVTAHKDRFTNYKRTAYDMEWNKQPIIDKNQIVSWDAPKPPNLEELIFVSSKLSHGLDFIRIDLYNDDTKIIFGEMTNYPDNGYRVFNPPQYDLIYGQAWTTHAPKAKLK